MYTTSLIKYCVWAEATSISESAVSSGTLILGHTGLQEGSVGRPGQLVPRDGVLGVPQEEVVHHVVAADVGVRPREALRDEVI